MPKPTRFQPKSFQEQEAELNKRVMEEVQANPIINVEQQPVQTVPVQPQTFPQQAFAQPYGQQIVQTVVPQTAVPQNSIPQNGVPVQVPVYAQPVQNVMPYGTEPVEAPKNKGGRKKSNRTIKRENGLTIFLEDAHNDALNKLRGTDKQEVIRVALDEFLHKYYSNGRFAAEAYDLIFDYIDKTTSK